MSVVCPALLDRVLGLKVNNRIIRYLVTYLSTLIKVPPAQPAQHGAQSTDSNLPDEFDDFLPDLDSFIQNISMRSRCTMSTILVTLIYIRRLATILEFSSTSYIHSPSSRHRVVFSALMISHKIWNDTSMIGKHWAEVSDLFDSAQVLAMEREILRLLRFELQVTNQEVWDFSRPFMCAKYLKISPAEQALLDASDAAIASLSLLPQPPLAAKPSPVAHPLQHNLSFSPSLIDAIPMHNLALGEEDAPAVYATEACHPYSRLNPATSLSTTSLSSFDSESVSPSSIHPSPLIPRSGSARMSAHRSSSTKMSALERRSKSGPHVLSPSARLRKKRQIATHFAAPQPKYYHHRSDAIDGAPNGLLVPSSISVSTSNTGTTWSFNGPFVFYS